MLKLSSVSIHKNAETGTNFASIQPATFIGLLIRLDASFFSYMTGLGYKKNSDQEVF